VSIQRPLSVTLSIDEDPPISLTNWLDLYFLSPPPPFLSPHDCLLWHYLSDDTPSPYLNCDHKPFPILFLLLFRSIIVSTAKMRCLRFHDRWRVGSGVAFICHYGCPGSND
jgi:hypothetical protein